MNSISEHVDMESVGNAIGLGTKAINLIKGAMELLPNGPGKVEIAAKVCEAERELQIFEAKSALKLGYTICQCNWPPGIMLLKDGALVCQLCKRTMAKEGDTTECRDELDAIGVSILEALANSNEGQASINDIARSLGFSDTKAEYHLTALKDSGYIDHYFAFNDAEPYYLKQEGRKELADRGLLK